MASIYVREHDPSERALRDFKRACEKEGILSEVRRREHYVKKSELQKRARAAARKRYMKLLDKSRPKRRSERARGE